MITHHRGAGHSLDRGMDIHPEGPEHADIDNESTHSSNAIVVLGEPETEGHPKDPIYTNHVTLTTLMMEINNLHQ